MGSSAVGLDCGLESSVSASEPDSPDVLSRAPDARLPRACIAPSETVERPAVAGRSLVDDCGEIRLVRERMRLTGFPSYDGLDKSIVSSGPKAESSWASMDGEVVWLFRKGRKIDSSIKSWIRFTAELSVSGVGGVVTSR